jgi:hypothetical protein
MTLKKEGSAMRSGVNKAEQWLQKFAYENPDSVLLWGSASARNAALIAIFYKPGWVWKEGVPSHPRVLATNSLRNLKGSMAKSTWIDPLRRNGEETIEGFLANNLAAKSFMSALVQTLSMARRPKKEAEEIVRRAAEKMYPDYAKRLRDISNQAHASVKESLVMENLAVPKPADGCLLCSIPENVDSGWKALAVEALELPRKINEKFGKETKKDVLESRKWTDKMLKSLKKKGLIPVH